MPPYAFLTERELETDEIQKDLIANQRVGVPYSQKDIDSAEADLLAQADPDANAADLLARYPKAQARDFDGNPKKLTEMDALVAYLQMLGTLVDFQSAEAQEQAR